ncbi:MAG: hypothetical protein M0P69_04405 [Bacteroidales bacterium]|nr:hypothetical protein [Bacteroidales bacterium]
MDNLQYIKTLALYWVVQGIPMCASDDTVSIEIRRLSDGYTWNFTTTEFTAEATTGSMTFVNGIIWKQSFTPPTSDTYIVTIENTTLDVKYVQVLKAQGNVAQSGATGSELTTYANVKEALGGDDSIDNDEDMIDNLIARVSDEVEDYCRRSFHAADYTEYYDGDNTDVLLMRNYPVNSVTSIHDDTDRVFGSDTAIDSGDIIIEATHKDKDRIRLDDDFFSKGVQNIKVVYNAGYSTIPTDLERAAINKVMADYLEYKSGINKMSGDLVTRIDKLREQADKTIERYRRY